MKDMGSIGIAPLLRQSGTTLHLRETRMDMTPLRKETGRRTRHLFPAAAGAQDVHDRLRREHRFAAGAIRPAGAANACANKCMRPTGPWMKTIIWPHRFPMEYAS